MTEYIITILVFAVAALLRLGTRSPLHPPAVRVHLRSLPPEATKHVRLEAFVAKHVAVKHL